MENKQLERQLKVIVQTLKGDEIIRIIDCLERNQGIFLNKNFTKSGINCTCCTLSYDKYTATGFGRNQQEALVNATKNYIETLISTNTLVPQLRTAMRQREEKPEVQPIIAKFQQKCDETLMLQEVRDICDISDIRCQAEQGCNCIYYEVHKHHITEIKNIEARMKLVMKQNEMLKQLLLKDVRKDSRLQADKENSNWKANGL